MPEPSLSLVNVFEVRLDGVIRHLVGFIDPVLAGARGIDRRAVLGEFTPGPGGGFDPQSFRGNPDFITSFQQFMNEVAATSPELMNEARNHPGGRLNIVDARYRGKPHGEPPPTEFIGGFAIDQEGRIVPGSFQYNHQHLWLHPETGASSILRNRHFYDWLHSSASPREATPPSS